MSTRSVRQHRPARGEARWTGKRWSTARFVGLLDRIENGTTDMADEVLEVPADAYTSREHAQAELDVLFLDHPLLLCLSGALPEPVSYRAVDLCGTPVLLTRDTGGKVRAMANACRHRGVRVADGCGQARRLTCPFHAWVYDLEGNLVGVPVAEGFDEMRRDDKRLVELPVAEGYGLIVSRLRPGPPRLVSRRAPGRGRRG